MHPDPRLAGYLKSNDPFPEKLKPALKDHLARLQHHISVLDRQTATLDDQIQDCQLSLEALQKKMDALSRVRSRILRYRAEAQVKKTGYEGVPSAIRRIPAEVIAKILAFTLPTRDGLLGRSGRSQFLKYRHVSKLWRATSLSTPSLWRGIDIGQEDFVRRYRWDGDDFETRQSFARCLTSWFSHAGREASVHLSVSPILGLKFAHILEFIRQSGFHVSSLMLKDGNMDSHFRRHSDLELLSDASHSYPTITLLAVALNSRSCISENGVHTFELAQSFPSLRTFVLQDSTVPPIPFKFAHKMLQHLQLNLMSYTALQFVALLQVLPVLETLQLWKCSGNEQIDEDSNPTFYVHHKLRKITLVQSVPIKWFSRLTFPSLELIHAHGDFGSSQACSDAGVRLNKLIANFPSNPSVVTTVLHQKPFMRGLLSEHSSIKFLEINKFSDLDPFTFQKEDDDNNSPSHPFLIPSSLRFIRCWERGTNATFQAWARNLRRYLRCNQELRVLVPNCVKGEHFLSRWIPRRDHAGLYVSKHRYTYRAGTLFREGKFILCFHARSSGFPSRSSRIAAARRAVHKRRIQKLMKGRSRRDRRQYHRESAIFSMPLVS
ncbi:hypothetical protein BKA70DRAFT_1482667 [Coprinopsis sp. MPI-PUGE-AT-0042]|nr:hypothetical protein BKA70DRAFT_1482667 [Coprinopsis sp. MPI-PUGE-AT-0042]